MTRLVGLVLRRGREERLAQGAGGLTFTTLLSLVPLLVVSFALFTRIPVLRPAGERVREHLLRGLLPPDIARTVLQYLGRFTVNAGGLTLAGSLFLVVSALALVLSVEASLNRIWQVKKPRPIPRRLALCGVLLLAGPVAIGASLWATSWLLAASGALVATSPPWVRQALQAAPVVLGAIAFACLYRFVPHAPVRRRDAIAGGVLAAVAFELGKRGFALYLAHVPTYRTVYGAFAPLLAFLVWVYYSWWVTLAAAVVSASLAPGGRTRGRKAAGA
ncbi:YhjD/YihY/BrkB family envelope integrity protein [Ramlibacter sp. AN1133]|uniref:YhjD/YihY/BrkB family envelope integrity protein n=1 Tax=Ramlibacter sp. AN1133 TaxID=3133429 RepID=UPI0030C206FE